MNTFMGFFVYILDKWMEYLYYKGAKKPSNKQSSESCSNSFALLVKRSLKHLVCTGKSLIASFATVCKVFAPSISWVLYNLQKIT